MACNKIISNEFYKSWITHEHIIKMFGTLQ